MWNRTEQAAWNRRAFIRSGLALATAPWWASTALARVKKEVKLKDYPFQLGVASGEPTPTGIVLWTRLAPDPLNGGGMPADDVEVTWVVAHDEAMQKVVKKGQVLAHADLAHAVHVEVEGLEPNRWYWYQFHVSKDSSPVARTRTAPAADDAVQAFHFAFASCQHYESGLFTAYQHMAREPLDLIVHLGDYIYEGAAGSKGVRQHVGKELETLEDYRNRHAQYKTDPHLQQAHAACPWLVTWDDHEFDNNCAGDHSEQPNVKAEDFLRRRAAAYRAYYEHMPLRRSCLPQGPDMLLYRRVSFGDLVDFKVLDTRQYRTAQPCGDGNKPPCQDVYDPNATLLGKAQREWLIQQLEKSPARWNVLAQQVMMGRVDRTPGDVVAWSMDQWPGYDVERKALLKFISERKVSNPIVLTGDIHTNWVNDLQVDFDQPTDPVVATEFVGTSISSGGDGAPTRADTAGVLAENPFVKFYNAERGYVSCSLSPTLWRSYYRTTPFVSRPDSPVVTRATFVVENGQAGAKPG